MTATIMSGRRIAEQIKARIKEEIIALSIRPMLATILVGDNPSSKTYLKNKHAACLEVGIGSKNIELPTTTSQRELESLLRELSDDPSITGILLQLPLPKGLNDVSAIEAISPGKDVDGLHSYNLGLLLQGSGDLVPCTPKGVMVILRYYGIPIAGNHAVIINRSKLVGRPLSQLLLNNDATVTVCHSKTRELAHVCKEADILIAGIGHRTEFTVGASIVKTGATVVDVGTSVINGKVTGDVDFADASKIAGYITPVPGGVGPMTIAMLLYNTLLAACKLRSKRVAFDPESLRNV
jgi:methylenetetrahydrofolate dehydrogenase (NADP+)/methenyltetrahydrofolate cyclohydrolase